MRLRVAPEVSFQPDNALDYATHINALMQDPKVAQDLAGNEA
jgi:ribosome-binding factor A